MNVRYSLFAPISLLRCLLDIHFRAFEVTKVDLKKKLYVSQITNDATNRNQRHHCFNPNNSNNNNNNNNNNSNFYKYYVSRITNDDATSRVQQHHYTLQYISSTTTTTTTITTKKIYRQIQPHQTNKKIRKM